MLFSISNYFLNSNFLFAYNWKSFNDLEQGVFQPDYFLQFRKEHFLDSPKGALSVRDLSFFFDTVNNENLRMETCPCNVFFRLLYGYYINFDANLQSVLKVPFSFFFKRREKFDPLARSAFYRYRFIYHVDSYKNLKYLNLNFFQKPTDYFTVNKEFLVSELYMYSSKMFPIIRSVNKEHRVMSGNFFDVDFFISTFNSNWNVAKPNTSGNFIKNAKFSVSNFLILSEFISNPSFIIDSLQLNNVLHFQKHFLFLNFSKRVNNLIFDRFNFFFLQHSFFNITLYLNLISVFNKSLDAFIYSQSLYFTNLALSLKFFKFMSGTVNSFTNVFFSSMKKLNGSDFVNFSFATNASGFNNKQSEFLFLDFLNFNSFNFLTSPNFFFGNFNSSSISSYISSNYGKYNFLQSKVKKWNKKAQKLYSIPLNFGYIWLNPSYSKKFSVSEYKSFYLTNASYLFSAVVSRKLFRFKLLFYDRLSYYFSFLFTPLFRRHFSANKQTFFDSSHYGFFYRFTLVFMGYFYYYFKLNFQMLFRNLRKVLLFNYKFSTVKKLKTFFNNNSFLNKGSLQLKKKRSTVLFSQNYKTFSVRKRFFSVSVLNLQIQKNQKRRKLIYRYLKSKKFLDLFYFSKRTSLQSSSLSPQKVLGAKFEPFFGLPSRSFLTFLNAGNRLIFFKHLPHLRLRKSYYRFLKKTLGVYTSSFYFFYLYTLMFSFKRLIKRVRFDKLYSKYRYRLRWSNTSYTKSDAFDQKKAFVRSLKRRRSFINKRKRFSRVNSRSDSLFQRTPGVKIFQIDKYGLISADKIFRLRHPKALNRSYKKWFCKPSYKIPRSLKNISSSDSVSFLSSRGPFSKYLLKRKRRYVKILKKLRRKKIAMRKFKKKGHRKGPYKPFKPNLKKRAKFKKLRPKVSLSLPRKNFIFKTGFTNPSKISSNLWLKGVRSFCSSVAEFRSDFFLYLFKIYYFYFFNFVFNSFSLFCSLQQPFAFFVDLCFLFYFNSFMHDLFLNDNKFYCTEQFCVYPYSFAFSFVKNIKALVLLEFFKKDFNRFDINFFDYSKDVSLVSFSCFILNVDFFFFFMLRRYLEFFRRFKYNEYLINI